MTPTSPLVKMTHHYPSRPQKQSPDPDIKAISRNVVVNGAEYVVSYGGTSQYNRDGPGTSACGLAALNFARIVFSMEQSGLQDTTLLQAVLARACAEDITAICALWSGSHHLEVEDICRVPLFEKTLKLNTTTYGHLGVSEFESLLTELSDLDSSAVVIITRPPEIIACLKLRLATRDVFIIFDSHPRPSYPNGAGMIVSPSIEGTARRLAELLTTVDLPDGFLQWEAQLLTNYSGHVFVPHDVETSTSTLWQAVLESSLAQLSMQAEIAELRSQNEFLKGEQQRLESALKESAAQSREQERLIRQVQQKQPRGPRPSSGSQKYFDHSFAPPRQFSSLTRQSPTPSSSRASTSTLNPFDPDSRSAGSSSSGALGHFSKPPTPPSDRNDSILEAMRLQNEFDKEDRAISAQRDDSILEVMSLQNEFDKDDRALSAQRAELAKFTLRFECGICMEEMPVDSIALPDPCGHAFCRECLRGHVTARLDERRFPILCPTCTAGKGKGQEAAGEVSQSLALDLGLTDEQYSIWTEMEMVSFSVPICCRKCRRTMFVARDDHEEAEIIVCPLPDCNHAWCKQCQQSIDFNGPMHSCDGTSELDHLMKQQGWKYCPTCKTPIQKISGCDHMSCMTPACNTHFCYICGDLIVRSALGQEINEATSTHYMNNCMLWAVPE